MLKRELTSKSTYVYTADNSNFVNNLVTNSEFNAVLFTTVATTYKQGRVADVSE